MSSELPFSTVEERDAYFKVLARQTFSGYVEFTSPNYATNWHHEVIMSELEEVEAGRNKRLMICFPPRHGKSELGSKKFPQWYMGRNPSRKIIHAAWGMRLAEYFGAKNRDFMSTSIYRQIFPGLAITRTEKKKTYWETTAGGQYMCAGREGGIQGFGANLLLVDDVFAKSREALSPAIRDGIFSWYQADIYPRLEDDAAIVIINTRLHSEDLIGRLLEEEKGDWKVITLPAIATRREYWFNYTREPGEALWPQKYPLKRLERIQRATGAWFGPIYQQEPVDVNKALFSRQDFKNRYVVLPRSPLYVVTSTDSASGDNEDADYSVMGAFYIYPGLGRRHKIYLDDLYRKQVTYPDLVRDFKAYNTEHSPDYAIVEDKSSGIALVQQLAEDSDIPCIPFYDFMRKRKFQYGALSKTGRAMLITSHIQKRILWLPEDAPWLEQFLHEVTGFPKLDNDDIVDMLVQFILFYVRYIMEPEGDEGVSESEASTI